MSAYEASRDSVRPEQKSAEDPFPGAGTRAGSSATEGSESNAIGATTREKLPKGPDRLYREGLLVDFEQPIHEFDHRCRWNPDNRGGRCSLCSKMHGKVILRCSECGWQLCNRCQYAAIPRHTADGSHGRKRRRERGY
ncbi:hypothetical protein K491DRAFT_699291 [Lophiostoma macrostomum CBS 122681]|uniref:Uncharacterized protein n=1 Tax=Lophiostoma macrostomum CBS 122681 TaxID=1314788 RepID=A0A6A6SK36_9PLEO|nr:hypothetical protein K491DRAFT_699291 [Lophiostoma macrostomum CBS 122681]